MIRVDQAGTVPDLFADAEPPLPAREQLGPGSWLLRGAALPHVPALLAALAQVQQQAPFRHLITPGGKTMSVAMTNCGPLGWVSDRTGYRYAPLDPLSSQPWPAMPEVFKSLAAEAAAEAGYPGFMPDACLINQYRPDTRLSLHQDRDERDYSAPIVSVSLGIPAIFLFGGLARADKAARVYLQHGDVVVFGGADRLRYHGVLPLKAAEHAVLGSQRINLTFRKAG
ncbi:MAG: DNA oxidative demethylase AlkB [Burkholderiales bacterium]|nr:DNA oxidative demethylase AlkB [Burkholderiales bacterium]